MWIVMDLDRLAALEALPECLCEIGHHCLTHTNGFRIELADSADGFAADIADDGVSWAWIIRDSHLGTPAVMALKGDVT